MVEKIFSGPIERIHKDLLTLAAEIFGSYPVLFAYLYGSYATGLVHPFSDLDIAIYVNKMPRRQYLDLELSLALEIDEKMESGVASEVRVMNELPLIITGKIVTEGILLFSRDEIIRVDFETSIRDAYFDFLPILQTYQRTYMQDLVS
ncbi:MAG: nucleotidyltransferase domain-containing protein [Deltaproteobacteria bacterium]|nr:nucleotidyltransferase domain-containing protein [Deltaproteobacteria bacterium]MBW2341787.1 nucleotidyltransferase domain-containing protein [Deltaproteobacteria bacterium]